VSKLFQLRTYFQYWLEAVEAYSLHSPFFYDFYKNIIKVSPLYIDQIESCRAELLSQHQSINITAIGATSVLDTPRPSVSSIARTSLSTRKFSSLYLRINNFINAKVIVELGTSLGVNTMYLAQKPDARVYTFEGNEEVASIAIKLFKERNMDNIQVIQGNIDHTLRPTLDKLDKVDFAFIDANHRLVPTLSYFNTILGKVHTKSVVVIDDIHYSAEMQQAWNAIRKDPLVYGSMDLYRCGILFFDPSLNKQDVILQF
jgi:predicted O-methyltransferase YrrM